MRFILIEKEIKNRNRASKIWFPIGGNPAKKLPDDIGMIKVFIIESEVGWGPGIAQTIEFKSSEEAEKYCKDYNNKHNPPGPTPDWYMYARLENQKEQGMLR